MSEERKKLTPDERKALSEKLREAVRSGRIAWQCCFCREAIEGAVAAIALTVNWTNGPAGVPPRSQQWFCHVECFIKATGERVDVLATS